MAYEQILFEQRGRVGVVTLNRPERLNAWTDHMMGEMRDAVERCNADPGVGAIVFTGAGRAYCAGADVSAFKRAVDAAAEGETVQGGSATRGEDNWVAFLQRMPKPTIAAINGVAVGVGITHILPFDIRIASENARIGMFFVKMGLVPELASSYYLSQLAGTGRALEWCLTGRLIPAQEAREAGLVTEVVAPEKLLDRALEIGEQVASQPAPAVAWIKRIFSENATDSNAERVMAREGDGLAACRATWEHREAVTAFMEKREPNFAQR
jgi:enoyl-CoA hydratase/carnithine racemase